MMQSIKNSARVLITGTSQKRGGWSESDRLTGLQMGDNRWMTRNYVEKWGQRVGKICEKIMERRKLHHICKTRVATVGNYGKALIHSQEQRKISISKKSSARYEWSHNRNSARVRSKINWVKQVFFSNMSKVMTLNRSRNTHSTDRLSIYHQIMPPTTKMALKNGNEGLKRWSWSNAN